MRIDNWVKYQTQFGDVMLSPPTTNEDQRVASYAELLDRIASLEAQARMVKALERQQAKEQILADMERYGLTLNDLRTRRRPKKSLQPS